MSKRLFVVKEIDKRLRRAADLEVATAIGGATVLKTPQHALDGAEHLEATDIASKLATIAHSGLLLPLSGDLNDRLAGDGSWVGSTSSPLPLPITAPLSDPPTETEFATYWAPATEVIGQARHFIDEARGFEYWVSSQGARFGYIPLVTPTPTGTTPDVSAVIELFAAPHGGFLDNNSNFHGLYDSGTNRTYACWLRGSNGDVEIGYYDHASGLPIGPWVVKAALTRDLHAGPAMMLRTDGTLVVTLVAHNDTKLRYRLSTSPNDPTAWSADRNIDAQVLGDNYTYASIFQLTDLAGDPTYIFVRTHPGGGVGHTNQVWSFTKTTDSDLSTAVWAARTNYYKTFNKGGYAKVSKTSEGRVDICVTSDAPGAAAEPPISVGHIYFDGTDWHQTDGTVITGLPFDFPDATLVYAAASGTPNEQCSPGDVQLGADDLPRLLFYRVNADYDIDLLWCRWTGSAWDNHVVTGGLWSGATAGNNRGGACFDDADSNVVYAAVMTSGVPEIHKFVTANDGTSFTDTGISEDSASQQLRPFSPLNRHTALRVLWASGLQVSDVNWNMGTRGSGT